MWDFTTAPENYREIYLDEKFDYGPSYEEVSAESPTPDLGIMTPVIEQLGLSDFSVQEIQELYDFMTPEEKADFDLLLRNSPPTALMPHQIVPIEETWWEVMLLVGGRGVGKTVTGASACREHLRMFGDKARIGIGAPTNADARDTCMEGPTGLITMFPNEFPSYNRSLGEARHISGGYVKAMGTEQPKRWNGGNWTMLWFDELALCNEDSWIDANMALRGGDRPYSVCTTTPKNRKWVKKLAYDRTTYVPQYLDENTGNLRLPTTFDNMFLPQRRVAWLKNKYYGSRIGRQELDGVFLDDIEGAKWNRNIIHHLTDPDDWPMRGNGGWVRTVVAIDPAGSSARKDADQNALTEEQKANQRKNADTAICVMSLGLDGKFYVREVVAGQWTPGEWAMKAIELFHEYKADKIVAEKNFGGDMVEWTIRQCDDYSKKLERRLVGRGMPIQLVTASRGKDIRAEPIVTLYEQKRVFHCKYFGPAEDQMCAFVDAKENEGADMVDAIVWAGIELAGLDMTTQRPTIIVPGDPRWRTTIVKY